ncbi:MAG TPA: thiamine pyrophosphate-dependent enzyme [candidate division Zixibacteria bacterium]|nr:thiamine pyrophosphate-dependent enzyme [candidate division Zixibacteria bacterium]
MRRYDCLKAIASDTADALVVCTGWAAREWWALRPGEGNFKTRTLGLVSSVATGLALALPTRKVIAIDGDGAFLMNLCGLPTIASQGPPNLIHLLFDNGCYEASGRIATASRNVDAVAVALASGYRHACWVDSPSSFRDEFLKSWRRNELSLIAAKVEPGQPEGLPPLELDELENKYRLMRYLERTEGRGGPGRGFDSRS